MRYCMVCDQVVNASPEDACPLCGSWNQSMTNKQAREVVAGLKTVPPCYAPSTEILMYEDGWVF